MSRLSFLRQDKKARLTTLLSLTGRRCECIRRLPEARRSRRGNRSWHIRCGRALHLFSIDGSHMIGIYVAGFDTSVGIVCRHDRCRVQLRVWPVWRRCPVHIVTRHRSCTRGPAEGHGMMSRPSILIRGTVSSACCQKQRQRGEYKRCNEWTGGRSAEVKSHATN